MKRISQVAQKPLNGGPQMAVDWGCLRSGFHVHISVLNFFMVSVNFLATPTNRKGSGEIALLALKEVRLAFNVENDLEELQDTMTLIKAVLLDAERQQEQNKALSHSIWKLRDLFYDAEDVIDEIECEAPRKEVVNYPSTSVKVRCLPSCFVPLAFSSKMGHKIKEINKRIDTIATEWDRFNLGQQVDNRRVIHRETHSFVNSSDVMGRDEDRENIINLLKEPSDESGNSPVILIVGIGGLGKTTLAQLAYNDERVIKLFLLRIWVCVSEEFDLRRLLKEMVYSINDVWNEDRVTWIELKNLLISMGLSYEDCLTLFTKWAFNDGDERRYPNLMRIGEKIVEKCKGVPLALYDTDYIIQFWMANGLLTGSNQNEEWEDIGITYFKELWLRCFVQDVTDHGSFYEFKMHDLIHDLASNRSQKECLTVNHQSMKVVEKVRHLSFSLDIPLGVPQSLKKLKRVRTIVVPPLPFAKENRSIDESFVNVCILNFKYLRLLDLSYTLLEELPESICTLKHLRYLDLSLCHRMRKIPSSICKLQSLLTLRLFGFPLIEVPEGLQSLISLRFLEITTDALLLRDIQPGCWSSLQFLHLYECEMLESIFDGMQHLTSLRRLAIQGASWSGALTDLPQLLLKGSASTLQSIKIEGCENFELLPEWLQNLTSLQKLEMRNCRKLSSLPEGMDRLTALTQLKIIACPTLSERCRRDGGADWPKISHVREAEQMS
ncbi:Leucine-rich repeat containing protein [Theobroma cacao]|uniref:Leucine-rich repeat containing protein n=1 Tax=Theobroma cacao TaxID=3641 RepID=A0A061F010_THECC|nr:Leucine-rich repeat containing protein [Theobroma cacao]